MKVVDIVCLVIIILGALAGFKKGAIKSLVHLVGLVAIVIVSFEFKGLFANIMIKYLPFFNYGGVLHDLYAINFLVYEGIAFAVIFILLYCVLNILVNLSGILDLLVKMTIVLELPSKIIGAILGAIEALVFVFVAAFIMLQFGPSQKYVMESRVAKTIVERTPIVNAVFARGIKVSEDVYRIINDSIDKENKNDANLDIVRLLASYGIISDQDFEIAKNNGKLPGMENVKLSTGKPGK